LNDRFTPPPSLNGGNHANHQSAQREHFVDANAVAEHLDITRRQVLEMTRRGLIPAQPLGIGKVRKVWRYKISAVEAAIACDRKPAASQTDSSLAASATPSTMPGGSSPSLRRKTNG
jgi:hypothetical protein